MALSQVSASLAYSVPNSGAIKLASITNPTSTCRVHVPKLAGIRSSFASGSPLLPLSLRLTRGVRRSGNRSTSVSIRSEQSTEGGNGLDIWLGRGAMIGFAVALTVEISTGKGLLENFGVASPLPTVALAVTALIVAELMESLHIPRGVRRVLFRTVNTDNRLMFKKEFDSSFAGFMTDGAKWLVENTDIKLIGLDYLSFAAFEESPATHRVILNGRDIIPVEALKLDGVEVGTYMLHCLPLRLVHAEGAPTRCILIQ